MWEFTGGIVSHEKKIMKLLICRLSNINLFNCKIGRNQNKLPERNTQCVYKQVLWPMQTDATSANNSQHCWVLLANNVANIVVVPCKQTQQVTRLLGPTMLGVVGQQCWVRLHGPLDSTYQCKRWLQPRLPAFLQRT